MALASAMPEHGVVTGDLDQKPFLRGNLYGEPGP
jgi:hypothetical protein